jgi:hypothetical protein
MTRPLVLLSAVLVSLAGVPAAPVPPPPKTPPLYFPTTVGTRWVYQTQGEKRESVEVVMEVKEKDGEKWVAVGSECEGKVEYHHAISVSDKGLAVVDTSVSDLDEPSWLLKLPHKAGNKWDYGIAPACVGQWKGTALADGPEKVTVPAGRFEAIRVKVDITFAGDRRRVTTWYAPGIGKVKEIVTTDSGDRVEVLKSFTPGKG